jgi:hypothetical protein
MCADDSDRMPNTLTVNTSGGGVKQRQPHCGTCAVAKITSAEQPREECGNLAILLPRIAQVTLPNQKTLTTEVFFFHCK